MIISCFSFLNSINFAKTLNIVKLLRIEDSVAKIEISALLDFTDTPLHVPTVLIQESNLYNEISIRSIKKL